ncbi:MAG: ChaN family lipoprotein [Pseudomonadota bacterium]
MMTSTMSARTPFTTRTPAPLLLALALAGCVQTPVAPAAATASTEAPTLPPELRSARFILLGEVHDNPLHHAWRAQWLRTLLADGRPTRVLFEQLDRAKDAELRQARATAPTDSAAIARAGGLDEKAWRWPLHQPLFDAALAGGADITGGNLARDAVRSVVRQGPAAVPADLQPLLDAPGWTAEQQRATEADIEQGHCGALPPSQLAPMALAQRTRDAAMAQAMLAAPAGTRVVLIAGNGHVRDDRGVPHHLRVAGVPPAQIASVGFIEVGDTPAPGTYGRTVTTPRTERPDPCEAFGKKTGS